MTCESTSPAFPREYSVNRSLGSASTHQIDAKVGGGAVRENDEQADGADLVDTGVPVEVSGVEADVQ